MIMKKYFLILFCATCTILNAQSYFISSNAHSLVDAYRDLVTQTNTKSCTYDNSGNPASLPQVKGSYYCTFNAMSAKGYSAGTAGFVSFSATYWYTHTEPKYTIPFHTMWFSSHAPEIASICSDCYQNPLVNPYPASVNMDNHSFEAIFVPVQAYHQRRMNAFSFAHAEDAVNPFAAIQIKASDIAKIYDLSMEGAGGYMNLNIPTQYNNVNSSVGLVSEVLLKNGKMVKCYLFNNYDGAGTMIWKVKKG
jgi:hypothetical protein